MKRLKLRDLLIAIALLAAAEGVVRICMGDSARPTGVVRSMTAHHLLNEASDRRLEFMPLAGVSHRRTWLCDEAQGPVYFTADRFGFNNQDSSWDEPADTVLIGDSFVQGYCVPEAQALPSLLTPRAGKVLNLGLKGTGPFSQLGVLLEYALPKDPKRVLWFILANDLLFDLERELQQPVLTSYHQRQLQSLQQKQSEIDKLWIERGAAHAFDSPWSLILPEMLLRWYMQTFTPQPTRPLEYEMKNELVSQRRIEIFAEVLRYAKHQAERQNIAIQFIFIPDSWVFAKAEGPEIRKLIARTASALSEQGITLLDPTAEYDSTGAPLREYAALNGYYGHFSREGFARLARFLENHL